MKFIQIIKNFQKHMIASSTCSSRSSYTDDSSEFSAEEDNEESSQESSESEGENEVLNAIIEEFPVNIICLEGLEDTLDSLLFGGKISNHTRMEVYYLSNFNYVNYVPKSIFIYTQ